MPSLAIAWDVPNSRGDLTVSGAGLTTGKAIEAAVLVSLFTDRRAAPDDVVPDGDRRGWWGDSYATSPIGSRMWLLLRAKRTTETARRAKDYIAEALQWMLDDGVAAKVDVETFWLRQSMLGAVVTIYRHDGAVVKFDYSWAWE